MSFGDDTLHPDRPLTWRKIEAAIEVWCDRWNIPREDPFGSGDKCIPPDCEDFVNLTSLAKFLEEELRR